MSVHAIPAYSEDVSYFGERVSALLKDVVRNLPSTLGYLTSKGGVASNDVLNSGWALRTSRVPERILPGCSVVRCPHDPTRYSDMPVAVFPGNVGDEPGWVTGYRRLSGAGETS